MVMTIIIYSSTNIYEFLCLDWASAPAFPKKKAQDAILLWDASLGAKDPMARAVPCTPPLFASCLT